ncbi:uncharacterized protein LOC142631242 isoform X3 [Castanea sativa]|uniref:uncharacterized protein LOC142631242 isoform X3 n=1 Tax=Castanea sativa TaxID=21020 RepID=UPI003F65279C
MSHLYSIRGYRFFAHLDQNASAQVNPLVISKYGASERLPWLYRFNTYESYLNHGALVCRIIFSTFAQDIAEIKELLKQKGGDVDC